MPKIRNNVPKIYDNMSKIRDNIPKIPDDMTKKIYDWDISEVDPTEEVEEFLRDPNTQINDIDPNEFRGNKFTGKSIFQIAVGAGLYDIVAQFIQKGVHINAYNPDDIFDKKIPLHTALYNKDIKMAKLLLQNGGDIDHKDSDSKTPEDLINKLGNEELITECKAARARFEAIGKLIYDLNQKREQSVFSIFKKKEEEEEETDLSILNENRNVLKQLRFRNKDGKDIIAKSLNKAVAKNYQQNRADSDQINIDKIDSACTTINRGLDKLEQDKRNDELKLLKRNVNYIRTTPPVGRSELNRLRSNPRSKKNSQPHVSSR